MNLQHYQKHQSFYEIGAFVLSLFINNSIIATSRIMEASRHSDGPIPLWPHWVDEYSSALGVIAIVPLFLWLLRRFPFDLAHIKRSLAIYFLASIVLSLGHVLVMSLLRWMIYPLFGSERFFGDIGFELLYEYRKDAWGFVTALVIVHGYQFILARLIGEASQLSTGEDSEANSHGDRLLVKKLGKEFIIKVQDIEWMEASGNYVNLHIANRVYPIRSTLAHFVTTMAERGFCRVHRSHAVNLECVHSIDNLSSGDGEITLESGKVLGISRRYKDELKKQLSLDGRPHPTDDISKS
ncbi:LytR/AlgR family response regulator transcription factor [Pseudoteredinibacter isoporae]|uniref:LytR/AlgR family response regulator transcription factor n=1 Tax=Pseudoteredinibacter isoporae TaxID=570281 RepID=UPI003102EF1B